MFATDAVATTTVAVVGAAPINEPVDPASFSIWVWIVGAALLVLIAAWYWWVFYFTRERSAKDADGGRRDRYSGLRKETLDEVDAAEARYREGEADLRTLHLDLNHIMREFANGRMRMDTSSLTVGEIATLEGTGRLSMLLEDYQEPAFASDSDAEALSATEDARGVIREW